MPEPNVGERDAKLRQAAAGAAFLFAAATHRKHPVMSLAATVTAVDLVASANARWCWALELLGYDTRALDAPRLTDPPRTWAEAAKAAAHP